MQEIQISDSGLLVKLVKIKSIADILQSNVSSFFKISELGKKIDFFSPPMEAEILAI